MDTENKTSIEDNEIKSPFQQSSFQSSLPMVAGLLMIFAGVLALFNWFQTYSLDITTIESIIDLNQIREIFPSATDEQIVGFFHNCAIIGIIISIFPILGGLFAIKRKMFGLTILCSVLGLFTIGILFSSSIFCFISLILLIISRQEFQ